MKSRSTANHHNLTTSPSRHAIGKSRRHCGRRGKINGSEFGHLLRRLDKILRRSYISPTRRKNRNIKGVFRIFLSQSQKRGGHICQIKAAYRNLCPSGPAILRNRLQTRNIAAPQAKIRPRRGIMPCQCSTQSARSTSDKNTGMAQGFRHLFEMTDRLDQISSHVSTNSGHLDLTVDSPCSSGSRAMPGPVPNSHRIRLFKNEHLEKLTLISPRVFAVSWAVMLPLIAVCGWLGADPVSASDRGFTALKVAGLLVAGLFTWTLFEYAMHRYLFHLKSNFSVLNWFVYLIHGNHHTSPNDPLRGLMPLPVSVSVGALIWAAFAMVLGNAGTWLFLGFMIGYVIYDTVHFACHQWPMRGRFGMRLKRHHMRHHYVSEDGNYGISTLFWDRIFGTWIRSLKRDSFKHDEG